MNAPKNTVGARRAVPNTAPESELDILHPERHLTLGGQPIIVREYAAIEWLRLLPKAESLIAAVADWLGNSETPTYNDVLLVLSANVDALLPLVAQAADLSMADVEALDHDDVELLLMAWWGCNGRFFIRRAMNRVLVQRQEMALKKAPESPLQSSSTGANSTPSSSPTAIDGATLATTPLAN